MTALNYAEIAERPLEVATPTSRETLLRLAKRCRVGDGTHVLDVGCGQGFLLRLWARHWTLRGTGLERSATAVAQARRKARAEGVAGRVRFVVRPAADAPTRPDGYDVVTCLGASFALGGFGPAVVWMAQRLRPGGVLAIGEPYLVRPLSDETRRRERATDLRTRGELVALVNGADVRLIDIMEASTRQWDRYNISSWRSAAAWARAHPRHPDRVRLEREADAWRRRYRRFARGSVGWALFVAEGSTT